MKMPEKAAFVLAGLFLLSCGPMEDARRYMRYDLSPPTLLSVAVVAEATVDLLFDEETSFQPASLAVAPALRLVSSREEGNSIRLVLEGQDIGREYVLSGIVEDAAGNSTNILARFYGFNPDIPDLRINEFTCRGSSEHPDKVELRVFSDGNMGGVVLYQGTPGNHEDRQVFPAFSVMQGDFIIVHFKPQGIEQETDETAAKDASGGLDASDSAFDFWVPQGNGISGNNGVLSLYTAPGGAVVDAVLYSNRTSDSDQQYLGFGTRDAMERALEIAEHGGWFVSGERIRPEDGINPEGSTATRSLCRRRGLDTDSREDWYIVPTRQATFGEENSEEVYTP